MKSYFIALILLLAFEATAQQNIGIGTTSPDPSAVLDVTSTDKGLLIPRMDSASIANIIAPAKGLMVFDSVRNAFYYYTGTGWMSLSGAGAGAFEVAGNTVRSNTSLVNNATDDFVFGSPQLDDDGNSAHDNRLFFNKTKGAFRVGTTTGTQGDDANVGDNSFSAGVDNITSGNKAYAMGVQNTVQDSLSVAIGLGNTSVGGLNLSMGAFNTTTGYTNINMGESNTITADGSAVIGAGNDVAGGGSAYIIGQSNMTTGHDDFAIGRRDTISGDKSYAVGSEANVSGKKAMALGDNLRVPSFLETAMGFYNANYTAASATNAVASDRLFSVGNGTAANRANALTILKNGNLGIGTTSPDTTFHVVGKMKYQDGSQGAGKVLTSDANGVANWQSAANNAWGLNGNTGTTYGTNYIGTAGGESLMFKVNGQVAGRIEYNELLNTSLGYEALFANTTGSFNVATGYQALYSNTTGNLNTANGIYALYSNTSGYQNTANGYNALATNTTGSGNTAHGSSTLTYNTTGNYNTANGDQALYSNTIGDYNTAHGFYALAYNTTGFQNTANGGNALISNTTGSNNTALGYSADVAGEGLNNATAIGAFALAGANNSLVLGSINGINGGTANAHVGIGTTTPDTTLHVVGKFKYQDGTESSGKVLTSDGSGLSSWQTPASLTFFTKSTADTTNIIYSDAGNYGKNFLVNTDSVNYDGNGLEGKMMYVADKFAFRAGTVDGDYWDKSNIGFFSTALGPNTKASGLASLAMGGFTTASGDRSTAMGNNTTASGESSTALGDNTIASGKYSTAVGEFTTAPSYAEIASGCFNTTYTPGSASTWNANDRLFGIGNGTNNTSLSDAMVILKNGNTGFGTSTPDTTVHIVGGLKYEDGNQNTGKVLTSDANGLASWQTPASTAFFTPSTADTTNIIYSDAGNYGKNFLVNTDSVNYGGASTEAKIMLLPSNGAFRAGVVTDTTWNQSQLGTQSFAGGLNTTASGTRSVAFGQRTIASGDNSFAMGSTSKASGDYSTALGKGTIASQLYCTAMGNNTTASSIGCIAMGGDTKASGYFSMATGSFSIASGAHSTAMGTSTKASGDYSMATNSQTIASGIYSTAMGISTTASGARSTAMGSYTLAQSFGEVAVGSYNDTLTYTSNTFSNDSNRVFTVGNGTSAGNRKTAFVIQENGNIGVNTRVPSEKLDITGSLKINDGTQGVGKVLTSDANGKASWQNGAGGLFQKIDSLILPDTNVVDLTNDDFVFGSAQLDNDGNPNHYARVFFNKSKGAFRAGYVFNNDWDEDSIGLNSIALGNSAKAIGNYSISIGNQSNASGPISLATGFQTNASGSYAAAMCFQTMASGTSAIAMGGQTRASGNFSTAMGGQTRATGVRSTAIGNNTRAQSFGETALGSFNDTLSNANATTFASDNNRIFTVGNGISNLGRSTAFVIQQDGNVGIGTSTATEKLHVVGHIKMVDGNQAAGKILTSDANGKASWQDAVVPVTTHSIVIPISSFNSSFFTGTTMGLVNSQVPCLILHDGFDEKFRQSVGLPSNFNFSTATLKVQYTSTATSGNFQFLAGTSGGVVNSGTLGCCSSNITYTLPAPSTANQLMESFLDLSVFSQDNSFLVWRFQRTGTSALDTAPGDLDIVGFVIEWTD